MSRCLGFTLPGFSKSGEFRADRVRGSGSGSGGGTICVLLVQRRTGNGCGATFALSDRLMVSSRRRWRGVSYEVAQVANATGSDREAPQAIFFQYGAIRSGYISETRLLNIDNQNKSLLFSISGVISHF